MDFRVLGPLEVLDGEHAVRIRPGRPRSLLVALVLRLNDRVSSGALTDLLWADETPRNSANALQILVSYLRKVLPPTGSGRSRIETLDRGYRLVGSDREVDARRLEDAATRAGLEQDARTRLDLVEQGLAEWRGAPAHELDGEPFAAADITRLHEVRLRLLEHRAESLLDLGETAQAVLGLQQLVAEHPLRERLHELLMTGLYREGRQGESLEVYDRARRTLRDELGLDPGPALQATAQAILRQSPGLIGPNRAVPSRTTVTADRDQAPPSSGTDFWRPLDELIGRDAEVARLEDLMTKRRLVTLTGPGGAGKTRLAAHLAAGQSEQVWWVDLSRVTAPEAVAPAIGQITSVPVSAGHDLTVFAGQHSQHRGLVVLDTCEHLRPSVKSVVEALLRAGSALRVLATSRQPLGAATELVWPVPPLSLPHPDASTESEVADSAAVQLFLERATSRQPDLQLTAWNAADIARICLVLDGLPLAIELAAAHSASLEPAEMVRILDDRLRLLVDDAREDRQTTLRATIAWSHDQLDPHEARFFERLSVFAGPFSIDAALAVAVDDEHRDGLEVLLALARQSLVTRSGNHYRMLDTIRAYAWERLSLDEAERRRTQRRHAEWYVRLVDEAAPGSGHAVRGWRGELRGALLDLEAALTWCFSSGERTLGARLLASLWWLWPREGVSEEAAEWFRTALVETVEVPELHTALLASAASYDVSRGELGSAIAHGSRAAARLRDTGDRLGQARVLLALGIAHWGRGEYGDAGMIHDEAVALFDSEGDRWGAALALVLRARTAVDDAEPDADERLLAAEAAARRAGDQHVLAAVLDHRARAAVTRADYATAAALAREALVLNDTHGHREGWVGSLHTLGYASAGSGDHNEAESSFHRALQAALGMHHVGAIAESLDGLGVVAAAAARWEDAARLLGKAANLRTEHDLQHTSPFGGLVAQAHAGVDAALGEAKHRALRDQAAALDPHQLLVRVSG